MDKLMDNLGKYEQDPEEEGEIDYDDVAIPEIHSKQHPAVSRDTRAKNYRFVSAEKIEHVDVWGTCLQKRTG